MKTWIGIALCVGVALALGLGMVLRQQQALEGTLALAGSEESQQGFALLTQQGCTACHSLDGRRSIGPSFLGMYGREERLQDGSSVIADEAYLRESIENPGAKVVAGYDNIMLPYRFDESELAAMMAFFRDIGQEAMAERERQLNGAAL